MFQYSILVCKNKNCFISQKQGYVVVFVQSTSYKYSEFQQFTLFSVILNISLPADQINQNLVASKHELMILHQN